MKLKTKQTNNKMTIQELRKEAGLVLHENPQLRLTELTDLPHPALQQFIMVTGHFFENGGLLYNFQNYRPCFENCVILCINFSKL